MSGQPLANLRVLVGGIIVDDSVDGLSRRDLALEFLQEANELLMAMALHVPTDDGPVENIEGGKQRRRSMPLVVMRHRRAAAGLHG